MSSRDPTEAATSVANESPSHLETCQSRFANDARLAEIKMRVMASDGPNMPSIPPLPPSSDLHGVSVLASCSVTMRYSFLLKG